MSGVVEDYLQEPRAEGLFWWPNFALELNFNLMEVNVFDPERVDERYVWLHEYGHYAQYVSTLFGCQIYLLTTLQPLLALEFVSRFLHERSPGQRLRLPLTAESNRAISSQVARAYDSTMRPVLSIDKYLNFLLASRVLAEPVEDLSTTVSEVQGLLDEVFGKDRWTLPRRFDPRRIAAMLPDRGRRLLTTRSLLESWGHLMAVMRTEATRSGSAARWEDVGYPYTLLLEFRVGPVDANHALPVLCVLAEHALLDSMGCRRTGDPAEDDFATLHPVCRFVEALQRANSTSWPQEGSSWTRIDAFQREVSQQSGMMPVDEVKTFIGTNFDRLWERASPAIDGAPLLADEIVYMGQVFEQSLGLRHRTPRILVNLACASDFRPLTQTLGSPIVFCPGHRFPLVSAPSFPVDDQDAVAVSWIAKQSLVALLRMDLPRFEGRNPYLRLVRGDREEDGEVVADSLLREVWGVATWTDVFQ